MKRLKVMKKSIIALTVMSFAAIMLSSCAEEADVQVTKLEKGDLALSISGTQTRSEAYAFEVEKDLVTFQTEDGSELTFEESVVDLNAPGTVTRGTPAYSENITSLANYKSFNAVIYSGTTEKYPLAPFKLQEGDENNRYIRHLYVADPFDDCDPMSLYMWMPTDMISKGVTFGTNAYGATNGNLTITFDYEGGETVGTAAKQEDILFSTLKITGEQYDAAVAKTPNAPRVLFFHALTGVKFAISNSPSSTDNVAITEIVFKGLKDKGTCVVTPVKENDENSDVTGTYSSRVSTVVNWTPDATTPVSTYSNNTGYSQTYTKDDIQDWSTIPDDSKFPDDFYGDKNGGKQNLNTSNAEYTFWLMPQAITSAVTLTITYTVNGGTPQTYTVNYGEVLAAKNVEWKAGELRTYSIRVDDVNVMIKDDVNLVGPTPVTVEGATAGETLDSYKGSTKEAVAIKNTGNTDVYIRAALIGQWIDEESGDPVFGYTDFTSGQFKSVASWYQDQFVTIPPATAPARKQGSFTGLPGTKWELHDDGFYYYTEPVAPGKIIGTAPTGATNAGDYLGNPLFTKYEVGDAPASAVAGQVKQIYFQLEIATQAISAMKVDGTHETMANAWAKANTPDPTHD